MSASAKAIKTRLQRACACGGVMGGHEECESCRTTKSPLRRLASGVPAPLVAPPIVHETLRAPGRPLDRATRVTMEDRLGHDFSRVRIHDDASAAASAHAVGALAYTVGHDVVFGAGHYAPHGEAGRGLLAHELTHVIQQGFAAGESTGRIEVGAADSASETEADAVQGAVRLRRTSAVRLAAPVHIARAAAPRPAAPPWSPGVLSRPAPSPPGPSPCLPASECAGPIAGSAEAFGAAEEKAAAPLRAELEAMGPEQAAAIGHGARAIHVERMAERFLPGKLAMIHGIFVDKTLALAGAGMMSCESKHPPIAGATKLCMVVTDRAEQQAKEFVTTLNPRIGTRSREEFRVVAVRLLAHELGHVAYDVSPIPSPSRQCPREVVAREQGELVAILSEFPVMASSISAGAGPAAEAARANLDKWFTDKVAGRLESISGILKKLRCKCSCLDVDFAVMDAFGFASNSWAPGMAEMFNRMVKDPRWAPPDLRWPL